MPYYRVNFETVVTAWVDVEAEHEEEAIDLAYEDLPYAPGFSNYDFGEFEIASEFQRNIGNTPYPEYDVEKIDEPRGGW